MTSITEVMRVTPYLPEFETDEWVVERFTVGESDGLLQLSSAFRTGRFCPPGEYTRLLRKHQYNDRESRVLVMSDTPDELRDHTWPLRQARGRVLLNGLGLGCVLRGILAKRATCPRCKNHWLTRDSCVNCGGTGESPYRRAVEHVDVVEVSRDLVHAMREHAAWCQDDRVTFHVADALDMSWPPNTKWDLAWHDIWTDITTDNLDTYARLNRMYGKRATEQGAWAYGLVKDLRDRWR